MDGGGLTPPVASVFGHAQVCPEARPASLIWLGSGTGASDVSLVFSSIRILCLRLINLLSKG